MSESKNLWARREERGSAGIFLFTAERETVAWYAKMGFEMVYDDQYQTHNALAVMRKPLLAAEAADAAEAAETAETAGPGSGGAASGGRA